MDHKKEERINGSGALVGPVIKIDSWAKTIFLFTLALGLGLLAINQGIGYLYKTELLKQPCKICVELNPGVQTCIDDLNKPRPSYWIKDNGEGHWTDPFNNIEYYEINLSNFSLV